MFHVGQNTSHHSRRKSECHLLQGAYQSPVHHGIQVPQHMMDNALGRVLPTGNWLDFTAMAYRTSSRLWHVVCLSKYHMSKCVGPPCITLCSAGRRASYSNHPYQHWSVTENKSLGSNHSDSQHHKLHPAGISPFCISRLGLSSPLFIIRSKMCLHGNILAPTASVLWL